MSYGGTGSRLNEAFATFLEMVAVDAWKHTWHRWDHLCRVTLGGGPAVDGLRSTRPIEFPVAGAARARGHVPTS